MEAAERLAWTLAQQGSHAARALWLTGLLSGLALTALVGLMLVIAARRRARRDSGGGPRRRGARIDAWEEAGRRMAARGPAHPRELIDGGADDDTRDIDPKDGRSGR